MFIILFINYIYNIYYTSYKSQYNNLIKILYTSNMALMQPSFSGLFVT